MKEKTANHISIVCFNIMLVISTALTVLLLLNFADVFFYKLIYGGFGIALGCMQAWSLSMYKGHVVRYRELKQKTTNKVPKEYGKYLAVYLMLTIISLTASLSFILLTIEGKQESIENESIVIQVYDEQERLMSDVLNSISEGVKANTAEKLKMNQKNGVYIDGQTKIDNSSEDTLTTITELFKIQEETAINKQNALNNKETKNSTKDAFELLGNFLGGVGGDTIMLILLLALSVILDLCLFITAPGVVFNIDPKKYNKSEVMFKYIDALLDASGTRINSDKVISENTNISLDQCKLFRHHLLNTEYNGKPLIISRQGGTSKNFSAKQMKDIIAHKLE